MNDQNKTREQLIEELARLRGRVTELEASRTSPDNGGGPWQSHDARWHSLAAHTPLLIFVLDQDHCIRFANHTDSGAAISQVVGKPFHAFCRPEQRDSVRECLQRVFQTGQSGLYEAPVLCLHNEEHWYASYVGPIVEEGESGRRLRHRCQCHRPQAG